MLIRVYNFNGAYRNDATILADLINPRGSISSIVSSNASSIPFKTMVMEIGTNCNKPVYSSVVNRHTVTYLTRTVAVIHDSTIPVENS